MKIVINTCFGGFGLSPIAIARLAELRGQKAYFFKFDLLDEIPIERAGELLTIAYNTPNPTPSPAPAEWAAMTQEERIAHNAKTRGELIDVRAADRSDPLLIQVVEELGAQASGSFARLKIVEIPDGVDWEIHEYDGSETIREKHRSWS